MNLIITTIENTSTETISKSLNQTVETYMEAKGSSNNTKK